jgi:hypothetical protein
MKKILNHQVTRIAATQNICARMLKDTGKEMRNLVKGIFASVAVIHAEQALASAAAMPG